MKKTGWCRLKRQEGRSNMRIVEERWVSAEESGTKKNRCPEMRERERRRGCWCGQKKRQRLKNRKDRLVERTLSGDSSASTRHYVAAGTNLYKGKTKTLPKIKSRGRNREYLGGTIFKRRGLILIGSPPLFRRVYRCSDSCLTDN